MSTRSNIAIANKDGKTSQMVYCHWDGYPEGVGRTLLNYYQDVKKIKALLKEGDISSLDMGIGTSTSYGINDGPYEQTTYQTVFYRRDRGEKGCKARRVEGQDESILEQEYLYIWKDGKWFYSDHGEKLTELTQERCNQRD